MWVAAYAKFRGWSNKDTLQDIDKKVLPPVNDQCLKILIDPKQKTESVEQILYRDRFIVLQGAPGTGKTHTALKIWEECFKDGNRFFEQFHAETNYSDFVYGLEPDTTQTSTQLRFKAKEGVLYRTIKYAQEHKQERVLLIIDEINRANLSNVLGPVFYLFEYQSGTRKVKIKVKDLELDKLPDNIKVIATMNTADRSLAVVDFALRRRFAWYTLRPHEIKAGEDKVFMKKVYNQFSDIFFEYATDEELNLQPGQSYFIVKNANKDEEIKERMVYELMPLIKEYLAEGYLLKAKDSFCDLFLKETGRLMYE
jgi:5-methylcytosine-specific restriction protein B